MRIQNSPLYCVMDDRPISLSLIHIFGKALAQVNEALAPLPEKDTGKKLAAIESTLTNSFWVTMQEGYEDTAEEYGVSIDVQATDSDTDTTGQLMCIRDRSATVRRFQANILWKPACSPAAPHLTGS